MMKPNLLILAAVTLLFAGCTFTPVERYTYTPPENIGDGLMTGSMEEVGLYPERIAMAVDSISMGRYPEVHSLLIYKDDRLVFEHYFKGHQFRYDTTDHLGEWVEWQAGMVHGVMSVTKSLTSVCIGIAVDRGFIKSVKDPIFDYLPDYRYLATEGREGITVEHLLSMTSGLDWNEWAIPYANPENDVIRMGMVDDPVAFILGKPMVARPGEWFSYSGGCNILLGEVLRHASGMDLDEFSGKYLFGPLGASPYYWAHYKNGVVDAAGSASLRPRDMLKVGVLFLNKGVWNGERIISEGWVGKSVADYPGNRWLNNGDDHWGMKGYGYMWWTHTFVWESRRVRMYYAAGWGGQFIMVIPEFQSVIVFTGGNFLTYRPSFEILKKYLLPASG